MTSLCQKQISDKTSHRFTYQWLGDIKMNKYKYPIRFKSYDDFNQLVSDTWTDGQMDGLT